jgi:hypothetical protein
MGRIIFLLTLLALAVYAYLGLQGGAAVAVTDSAVIRDTGDLRIQFDRRAGFSGTFMIFGGHIDRALPNSFTDTTVAGLDVEDARVLYRRYPDFHLCRSPGARVAQSRVQTLSLIARDRSVSDVIEQALALHMDRIEGGGERTCISLEGEDLALASVTLAQTGDDISHDVVPRFGHTDFYFAEYADIVDCGDFLGY